MPSNLYLYFHLKEALTFCYIPGKTLLGVLHSAPWAEIGIGKEKDGIAVQNGGEGARLVQTCWVEGAGALTSSLTGGGSTFVVIRGSCGWTATEGGGGGAGRVTTVQPARYGQRLSASRIHKMFGQKASQHDCQVILGAS